jgi:ABC-type dipeptide/oligopeptide/nickel transport system permease component
VLRYIAGRVAGAVPILLGTIILTFVLIRLLPGDPAIFFASSPNAGPEEILEIRKRLGLDQSLFQQLFIYLRDLLRGEFGQSLTTGQPVLQDIANRLPASVELTVFAFLLSVSVSIPLGVTAALYPNTPIDHLTRIIATMGVSMPTFVTGIVLIYVFYYLLGVAPDPTGRFDVYIPLPPRRTGFLTVDSLFNGSWPQFRAALAHLMLPGITMALFALAPIARITRAAMLGVMGSDYIRTARSLGLPRQKIIASYALRNALIPVVTSLGMVLSYMLGANVLVEKVFAWPGIGSYALDAIVGSDYAPVQGFILTVAMLFIVLNLLVDILYGLIDPRVGLG